MNGCVPSSLLADRWHPTAETVRRAALAALVMSVVIVLTGGAVRLTASGLGCTTWPRCTGESLTPTPAMGLHGVIEFTNRMLTYVLCAAIAWATLAARCATLAARPDPARLGAVLAGREQRRDRRRHRADAPQPVRGGAAHGGRDGAGLGRGADVGALEGGDGAPRALVAEPILKLSRVLVLVVGLLVLAGTLVTGAGHHPGSSGTMDKPVRRIMLDYDRLAQAHADLAFVAVGLTIAVIFVFAAVKAPRAARARVRDLMAVLLLQGLLGFVQYFTDAPEVMVGVHMLGAALTWIAALRIPFALRTRADEPAAVPVPAPQAATV